MPPFTAGLIVSASLVASALATAGGWNGHPAAGVVLAWLRQPARARPRPPVPNA